MNVLRSLTMAVSLLLALAVSSFAQTTVTSTTLAAAVGATDTQINVASATGIEVGDRVAILARNVVAEFVRVRAINGTFLTVSRGVESRSVAHVSGATVYHAPDSQFYLNDPPVGTACTSTSELYLPHINRSSKLVTQCSPAGVWYRLDETFNVVCRALLVADQIDQSCWQADGNYVLVGIREVHTTAESGGTLTLIIRRQEGTEAAASGDALNTAIDMVGAGAVAQTVKTATLTGTGSLLLLDAGDRLGLDFTDDVAGELAGTVVTLTLAPR